MALGVLIALDDFPIGHFHKFITVPNAFDIADRFPTRLMDHAERHRLLGGDGGAQLHGDEDEGQAEIARPERGRRHDKTRTAHKRESESGAPDWPRKRNKPMTYG